MKARVALLAAALASATSLILAGPAAADPGGVSLSANILPLGVGGSVWNIKENLTLTNDTDQAVSVDEHSEVTVGTVFYTWTAGGNSDSGTNPLDCYFATDTSTGWFVLAAHSSATCSTTIVPGNTPYSADNASITQTVYWYPGAYPNVGDRQTAAATNQFVQNGAPLPVLTEVGGPLLAAGVGGAFLLMYVRKRRRGTARAAAS